MFPIFYRSNIDNADPLLLHSFTLMPNTGKLSTCVLELDYEKVDAYTLKIETTDSGSPRLSFTGTIIVNVTDVNEAPTNITLTNDEVGL